MTKMSEVGKLPKPQLRGFFKGFVARWTAASVIIGLISMPWYYYRVIKPQRERWERYMSTVDADKLCDDLVKAGAYKNFAPDGRIVDLDEDDDE